MLLLLESARRRAARSGSIRRGFVKSVSVVALGLCFVSACRGKVVDPVAQTPDCFLNAIGGITVTAVDSATATTLSTSGHVEAHDGSYQETAYAVGGTPMRYYMAYERPGIYEVTVDMPGYRQ